MTLVLSTQEYLYHCIRKQWTLNHTIINLRDAVSSVFAGNLRSLASRFRLLITLFTRSYSTPYVHVVIPINETADKGNLACLAEHLMSSAKK